MPRYSLAAASLFVALPAVAQTAVPDAIAPRPTASIDADARTGASPTDGPLSDDQLARRLARLYERQAQLLAADADGNRDLYVRLLDDLVVDLQMLAQRPGVMFDARFREAYASVLTEQERFYGEPALDRGDVYTIREAGIRAVELGFDNGAPLLEHVTLPDRATYATTIPMDVNVHVERYVQFLVNRRGHIDRLHQRADTYFPMIERVLAEEGVPDELKYLSMVESALNPIAQSHMAAAGLWQFIRATGAAYGLQASGEVDDRLDPEQATRAAARHLRDLHDRFGDWHLALAGYNCNPAVIARAVRRFEERTGRRATYWDIRDQIPRETQAYIPAFIATSLVASNPAAYGIALSNEPGVPYAFDRIPVAGGTTLAAVARAAGTTEAALRALNPSLRAGRVPSNRGPQTVRIPLGLYTDNVSALEALAPPSSTGLMAAAESVQFGPRAVRPIAPQERMQALQVAATRRATTPRRGADAPVNRPNTVDQYAAAPPRELTVFQQRQARESGAADRREAAALAEQLAVAQRRAAAAEARAAALEQQVSDAQLQIAQVRVQAAPAPAAAEAVPVQLVATDVPGPTETAALTELLAAADQRAAEAQQRADELEQQIAAAEQQASEAADAIAQAERQAAEAERRAAEAVAEARPAAARTPVRVVSAPERRAPTTHRVARGETLSGIATQHGLTVQQLRDWNGIEGNALYAGRTLRLTGDGAPARRTARAAAPAAPTTYTVRSGDNLTRIAARFGVSVRDLQQWNRLTDGSIRAGQTLRVARPARG